MKKLLIILILIVAILFLFWQKQEEENLKNEIGQMIMVGFRGETAEENDIKDEIKNLNIGGVILFDYDSPSKSYPRNITSKEQLANLTESLQKEAKTPLFIAVDAEGGLVNRLKEKYGFLKIPSPAEMGQEKIENTIEASKTLAEELKLVNINLNFAPVVDVNINPENPVIGGLSRSFSKDPQEVFKYAQAFIQEHHKEGIMTAIKHFPGHGSSELDSHKGLVDVTETYQELELIPFLKLVNETDMVMTAHIMNKNIDPDYPATLSQKFLKDILRNELGFKGVIVSDDMQMGAIVDNFGFEESIIKAIKAGCDILLFSNNADSYDPKISQKAIDIIYQAVLDKKIEKDSIIDSLKRIKELKEKYLY